MPDKLKAADVELYVNMDVHRALEAIAEARIERIHDELEGAKTMDDVKLLLGERRGIRWLLKMPKLMLEDLQMAEERANHGRATNQQ
jgi:hypothetical protein